MRPLGVLPERVGHKIRWYYTVPRIRAGLWLLKSCGWRLCASGKTVLLLREADSDDEAFKLDIQDIAEHVADPGELSREYDLLRDEEENDG
jgi:hypothetical protein